MFRNFRMVSYVVFGRGSFNQLDDILSKRRKDGGSVVVFCVDDVHKDKPLKNRLPLKSRDLLLWVNADVEPKTSYVDQLTKRVKEEAKSLPAGVIGIGGGRKNSG
jgi:3-deoxy-alpha-D-manno-octulosonate 8-oxidase